MRIMFAKCILSACILVNVYADYRTRTYRAPNIDDQFDMTANCGTTMVIAKRSRPVEVYFSHGHYAIPADCRLTVHNEDDTFYRISLQFKEFYDLQGFCIYASNFESIYNGAGFCSGTPPIIREVYTSLPGTRGFELRVNGSGGTFMSFRILLTTFHTGKCYNQTCGNERCVPRSQLCKGAYPCGDDWDCYNSRAPNTDSADHLIIFCCVATSLVLLTDVCWRMQAAKAKEEALRNVIKTSKKRKRQSCRI